MGCGHYIGSSSITTQAQINQLEQELRWKWRERSQGVKVKVESQGPRNKGDQSQVDRASQDAGNKGDHSRRRLGIARPQ